MARPTSWVSSLLTTRAVARLGKHEVGAMVALFVGAMLILLFGLVAEEVVDGDTAKVDRAILIAFRTPGQPLDPLGPEWFEEMVRDVTALGSYAFVIIILTAALGYLLLMRKYGLALLLIAAEAGGMLFSTLLKELFDRPRPDLEHAAQVFTASFPSGHATLSAVTFLTLGALLTRVNADRKAKLYFMATAIVLTIMVGLSRLYLGVHYPSDIVAGWCIGSAWAVLCWGGALWLQRRGDVERPTRPTGEPRAADPPRAQPGT